LENITGQPQPLYKNVTFGKFFLAKTSYLGQDNTTQSLLKSGSQRLK